MPSRLYTPGPTPVPAELTLAMAAPLPHHRTPEFRAIFQRASASLQEIHRTPDPVLVLTSSGTGAMEAAVVNLTLPNERVLALNAGKFGARWGDLLRTYGRNVDEMSLEWGASPDPARVRAAAIAHGASSIFVTHSETSTGALADLERLGSVAREIGALLVADCVTSLAVHPIETQAWGIDCVVSGSQKGYMLPPGLAFVSLSERARSKLESNPTPRFYFDLRRALRAAPEGQSPWTPAITLVVGLERACRRILDEGLGRVWRRHAVLAEAVRAGVRALGLEIVAIHPSNALTAIRIPERVGANAVRDTLSRRFGVRVAGGQERLQGKVVRVGHLGAHEPADIVLFLGAFEAALAGHGHALRPGTALAAAEPVLAALGGDAVGGGR